MSKADCTRAEVLAGAIALGEASDGERDDYRRHLSTCARCLDAFGGEREIERVMATVNQARDEESWEPDVAGLVARRRTAGRRTWKFGLSAAAIAIVASVGIHSLIAANVQTMAPLAAADDGTTVADTYSGPHITLEKMPAGMTRSHAAPPVVAAKPHDILVEHNVVTLKPPATSSLPATAVVAAKPQPARKTPAASEPVQIAAVTPSESERNSISALKTAPNAGLGHEERAESMAVMPNTMSVHDVSPIGGDKAIEPHPASIAYAEGAEGTTAYEVVVDERGVPLRCTIAKSSGYLALDEAVCKAALRARFSPRTVNGKAVVSVYQNAYVFRAGSENP